MRVPRTQGLPNRTSGVIEMRSKELMRQVYGNYSLPAKPWLESIAVAVPGVSRRVATLCRGRSLGADDPNSAARLFRFALTDSSFGEVSDHA